MDESRRFCTCFLLFDNIFFQVFSVRFLPWKEALVVGRCPELCSAAGVRKLALLLPSSDLFQGRAHEHLGFPPVHVFIPLLGNPQSGASCSRDDAQISGFNCPSMARLIELSVGNYRWVLNPSRVLVIPTSYSNKLQSTSRYLLKKSCFLLFVFNQLPVSLYGISPLRGDKPSMTALALLSPHPP